MMVEIKCPVCDTPSGPFQVPSIPAKYQCLACGSVMPLMPLLHKATVQVVDAHPSAPPGALPDPIEALEAEMKQRPAVYGTPGAIVECYHAIYWAASTFGPSVRRELVQHVHRRHPRLCEIEHSGRDAETFADVRSRYFEDETTYAQTIDILAEGVTTAQDWLRAFMKQHALTQISVMVPRADGEGALMWRFGRRIEILDAEGKPAEIAAELPE